MSESTRERPEGVDAARRVETPAPPSHLVITVHGIRTFGDWQAKLEEQLKEAEPGIKVLNYKYYFSSFAFLLPPVRWWVARRFRNYFVQAIQTAPEGAKIDLVAHSFGTYLAASALLHIPKGRQITTVIFAGSVLRASFPWYKYEQTGNVGRVVNECGWDDSILLLCQFTALMMGMAGRVGFQGMVGQRFTNRYYQFGHGGYFDPEHEHRFMREHWLPLLTSDASVLPIDLRPRPFTAWDNSKLFLMNNLQFIKVAAAALMLLVLILFPLDWWRKADYEQRTQRSNHIARLTNAARIPGRDPKHVRDLLSVDARHQGHEDKAIEQMLGKDVAPEGDDQNSDEEAEAKPPWWGWLTDLIDPSREAFRARQLHARANFQLAAGKPSHARDMYAKQLYDDALSSYKRVENRDPAHGSYALCLMDYGLLLTQMGLNDKAREQFRMVREEVFPPDAKSGERPTMPLSLLVDSLCNEAMVLRNLKEWNKARALLVKAVSAADGNDALTSLVYDNFAWYWMDRLNVAKARELFIKAKESCEKIADDEFIFKTRLFKVRHGLAMTQRLRGRPDESYNQYDQIVKELQELMKKDFNYYPKQRRDLSDRLVNSMERRADVWFFTRKPAADRTVMKPASDPGSSGNSRDDDLAVLEKVEEDYDAAIRQVENDDPATKTKLLYKKVIAHVIGEVRRNHRGVGRGDSTAEASPLEATRFVFAEADRTYNVLSQEMRTSLKIYHEIAAACMKLCESMHDRSNQDFGQAVAALREHTSDYAKICEDLEREPVEMLLVALELLLEPRIADAEPSRIITAQDASRMLAVLGIAMKASAHEELRLYVDRLNRIASARLLKDEGLAESPPRIATTSVSTSLPAPRIPPERLLFFLRLSPTLELKLTARANGHDVIPGPLPVKIEEADDPSTGPKGASRLATVKP
jgi:tetratricopeptide (TPR) repeat protein